MNWKEHYDKLCKKIFSGNTYKEVHHIVPRCLGGGNEKSNLVALSPREHFIAHLLLVKIYPNELKLKNALWMMSHRQGIKITSRRYEYCKMQYSSTIKGQTKETNASVAKQSDAVKGRTKETHPGVARVSLLLSGRTKETHPYIEEASKKMAETKRGRTKDLFEGVAKQAEAVTKLPIEIRNQLIAKRTAGATYQTLLEWCISLGYDVTYHTIRRTFYRHSKTEEPKVEARNKVTEEIRAFILSKRHDGFSYSNIGKSVFEEFQIELGNTTLIRVCKELS